ncbi:transposase [Streptomyces sp. L7]
MLRIRFATETCAPCPARAQCTSSIRYGRQLTVRPQDQDAVLERVRAEQETEEGTTQSAPAWRAPSTRPSPPPALAVPLRRTAQDRPRTRPHSHRHQPHPHRCLVDRATTRPTRTSHLAALDLAA